MTKQTQEHKKELVVRIFRKDGEIIDVLTSENFKECKDVWKKLLTQWQECHTEQKIFILEKPIVTGFEPGLISEILVVPKINPIPNVNDENPYFRQMTNKGLTQTMRGAGEYPDILDSGYNI